MTSDQQSLFSQTPTVDLEGLNPAQREAVECTRGPLLVLAGAGSGKTRVLTYRIAHMIADEGVRPWQVLAITFTNKAAAEMRERLGALLPYGTRGMWVCTFHAMCVRILREDGELVGYRPNFTIYDDDDSRRLVKAIMSDLDLDQKQFPLNSVRAKISAAKNALVGPDELASSSNPADRAAARVYRELDRRLARANAMDFDDLLVKTFELLSKRPEVLGRYQDRFRQISVDEYQDTNHVQYAITNLLAARHRNLMVVGDDDQSIYSWRGADIQNILDFEKDYPDARVVRLEQNYRSTGHILAAANAVVANNARRKPKRLFTDAGDGEKIRVFQASDERDEGRWIGSEIERLHDGGTSYDDMAVFYRTNAQSRILEDMFLRAGVPYKIVGGTRFFIVGGTRFFDRAEVRDVMAYLKLVVNPDDDVSALRVVNTPRRGIGTTSIAKIRELAAGEGISFFSACQMAIAEEGLLGAKVRSALAEFTGTIEAARHFTGELVDVVDAIVDRSGLVRALEAEHSVEADGRIENIKEFLGVAAEFDETHDAVETLESLEQLRRAGAIDEAGSGETSPAGDLAQRASEASAEPVGDVSPGAAASVSPRRLGEAAGAHRVAGAEVRPRLARRSDPCRHDDEDPLGKGPRVPGGVRRGHGGGHLPARLLRRRRGERGGGAAPGLRCHHARAQTALPHARHDAAHLRVGAGERPEPLSARDSREGRGARGRGVVGLCRRGLGEARRPPRHVRQRARLGGLRRARLRLPDALDGRRRRAPRCPERPQAGRRARRGVLRARRPRLAQDLWAGRGPVLLRGHDRGQVHAHGQDEEAAQGLCSHRQDRGVTARGRSARLVACILCERIDFAFIALDLCERIN